MARKAGVSIPKYRKHKASGQAVVVVVGVAHYWGRTARRAADWNTTGSSANGLSPAGRLRTWTARTSPSSSW